MENNTTPKLTFVERFLEGLITSDIIHDFIDEWHESNSSQQLHEFLGFTKGEYVEWVKRPEKGLIRILEKRNKHVDKNGNSIINGSIIDLHQTVNGENIFVVLDVKELDIRYGHDISSKYQYDCKQMLEPNAINGEVDWEIVGNITGIIQNLKGTKGEFKDKETFATKVLRGDMTIAEFHDRLLASLKIEKDTLDWETVGLTPEEIHNWQIKSLGRLKSDTLVSLEELIKSKFKSA